MDHDQSEEHRFKVDSDSEHLQDILNQIDQVLKSDQTSLAQPLLKTISTDQKLLPLERLIELGDWIKMSSAPLQPSIVGGLRGFFWRFLNIPARIFLPSEIMFNRKLREFIGELIDAIEAMNSYAAKMDASIDLIDKKLLTLDNRDQERKEENAHIDERIKSLENQHLDERVKSLENYQIDERIKSLENQHLDDRVNSLENYQIDERIKSLENYQIDKRIKSLENLQVTKWLEALQKQQVGTEEWIQLIGAHLNDLALEMRTLKNDSVAVSTRISIQKPVKFAKKIQNMQGKLKINLGSGHKILEDYINIDFRDLPGIDIVSNIVDLPFLSDTVDEISSSHLVEHFREYYFKTRLLPYWSSLLRKGGMLRIICPNWQAMINRLQSGDMPIEQFKLLTFGGQDYEGNDHYAMYTPETLSALLTEAGFVNIQFIAEDRDNGGCPEMELVAMKPI